MTGFSPVGSPITAALARGRPNSAMVRAPSMEVSSSAVARIINGCLNTLASSASMALITTGKKPFMSVTPRPYRRLSFSVRQKGSTDQSSLSKGTVSVCPAKTRPPGPVPLLAMRLTLPGCLQGTISQLNPRLANCSAR